MEKNTNTADLKNLVFEILLVEWSLHKTLFSKKIKNIDFWLIAT